MFRNTFRQCSLNLILNRRVNINYGSLGFLSSVNSYPNCMNIHGRLKNQLFFACIRHSTLGRQVESFLNYGEYYSHGKNTRRSQVRGPRTLFGTKVLGFSNHIKVYLLCSNRFNLLPIGGYGNGLGEPYKYLSNAKSIHRKWFARNARFYRATNCTLACFRYSLRTYGRRSLRRNHPINAGKTFRNSFSKSSHWSNLGRFSI